MTRHRVAAAVGTTGALVVIVLAVTARAITVEAPIDLGTLGGTHSFANAVNDSGMVVGSSSTPDTGSHAFVWTQAGGMVDLGTLGGTHSFANAVNDSGMVVGSSSMPGDSEFHAFVWTQARGMVDLGTLGGTGSDASAVNNSGMVVGSSSTPDTERHAFVWTQTGGMVDLGTLGGIDSHATAVNDNGMVVGFSSTPGDTEHHAFVWTQAGGMVDLGTLGSNLSFASAVNNSGMVVGNSETPSNAGRHGFVWTQAGGMVDIGTFGGTYSFPKALNGNGMVVGESATPGDAEQHAFAWTPAGGMVDLGSLGTLGEVWAVNDNGLVVGDDGARAFALTLADGMVDLGTLGGDFSAAAAVNNSGMVVGAGSTPANAAVHATLWYTIGPESVRFSQFLPAPGSVIEQDIDVLAFLGASGWIQRFLHRDVPDAENWLVSSLLRINVEPITHSARLESDGQIDWENVRVFLNGRDATESLLVLPFLPPRGSSGEIVLRHYWFDEHVTVRLVVPLTSGEVVEEEWSFSVVPRFLTGSFKGDIKRLISVFIPVLDILEGLMLAQEAR